MVDFKNLTLDEKLKLLVLEKDFSSNSLDGKISTFTMSDGPNGLRMGLVEETKGGKIHCYPALHVLANTWSRDCSKLVGRALASDCIDYDIDIILAPGINIKRTPLCGRNFEYYSEDPFLTGELASEYVIGCQEKGVGTSLKHFCCNNREYDRLHQTSEVDLRTLRELYTKAFEIVISKAKPCTIMCSYNPVNGINVAENEWLLNGILRGELHYEGVIVSDWGAVHERAESLKAGLDIMCPYASSAMEQLEEGLKNGLISEKNVDESVERIENLMNFLETNKDKRTPISHEERYNISLKCAEEGCVLLKNQNNLLPIREAKKIVVVGELSENPDYTGGGSAEVILKNRFKSLHQILQEKRPDIEIAYGRLYSHYNCTQRIAGVSINNIQNVLDLAYDSDVTIMLVGDSMNDETESIDRASIRLDERMEHLISCVAQRTERLIVVVEAGSSIDMSPWIDKAQAVVYTGFAGEALNEALANILLGEANPSGRLSETFPLCLEDTPTGKDFGTPFADRYKEGVLVGYRHYLTKNIPVLFPFGYGLSYSNIEYSNFSCEQLGNAKFLVSFSVTNNSEISAKEVCQLYVDNIDMKVERPKRELRRFTKVDLAPHETKTVEFELDDDCFAYFNVCYNDWWVDKGRYEIVVAKNAATPIFTKKIMLK